ncbi:MAG: hypothetical protein ISR65_06035 [Bacteriovoracaceae bacterium]|nr:hypothetical protein [Bacteriovoracaceae bacterium]
MGTNTENMNIKDYKLKSFTKVMSVDVEGAEDYNFRDLEDISSFSGEVEKDRVLEERERAISNSFKINPIVKEHRGFFKQEEKVRETRIKKDVERQIDRIKEEARKQGYEEGVKQGREDVYNQTKVEAEEKIERLSDYILEVVSLKEEIMQKQKKEIFELIKNLCRWVILRELEQDGEYLSRLLEKLIEEIKVKSNLLLKVNADEFENMSEVLRVIKEKIGQIPNVRVEVDHDMDKHGIILESENGIIDASLPMQFQYLEKLFESVGIYEVGPELVDDDG